MKTGTATNTFGASYPSKFGGEPPPRYRTATAQAQHLVTPQSIVNSLATAEPRVLFSTRDVTACTRTSTLESGSVTPYSPDMIASHRGPLFSHSAAPLSTSRPDAALSNRNSLKTLSSEAPSSDLAMKKGALSSFATIRSRLSTVSDGPLLEDATLEQVLAGDGFASRQTKPSKLILLFPSMTMFDLVVAANLAMWVKVIDEQEVVAANTDKFANYPD